MNILHISTECYPAAKVGGLGDVVGALPKYMMPLGANVSVIIPKYRTKWLANHDFTAIYRGAIKVHKSFYTFTIEQEKDNSLDFPLFVVNLPEKFDRLGVYNGQDGIGYADNMERFLAFNLAVLQWLANSPSRPDLLHCHDHPTGLIPFLVKHTPEFKVLKQTPTLLTIHNAAYHGAYGWEEMYKLPWFDRDGRDILDWNDQINPLAVGIKMAWRVTTVSPTYLEEIRTEGANGLEWLIHYEQHKSVGILNGIDQAYWNPSSDDFLEFKLNGDLGKFKQLNKDVLKEHFGLENDYPIVTFIGRLAKEKGADLLPDLIKKVFSSGLQVNLVILGIGDERLMIELEKLGIRLQGRLGITLAYNETLAHALYAGSDFLFMPSRTEPCGLNQMYAMRYGAIPIVRSVGGLKDTVIDIDDNPKEGTGIRFDQFSVEEALNAILRAADLYYNDDEQFEEVRDRIVEVDFSWERSAKQYLELYTELYKAASASADLAYSVTNLKG